MNIDEVIAAFPKRSADAHKGDFGHVLILAGSANFTGAPYLTSQGAVLSGSGLVTLGVGKSIFPILASKLTEVMVRPFFETRDYSLSLMAEKDIISFSHKCSCIAMGPGMSLNKETQSLVQNLVRSLDKSVVLDADGINSCVGNLEILKDTKAPFVLTPHIGEFARLIGKTDGEVMNDRKNLAQTFANEYNTVLVLKGHDTIVAAPSGDIYINDTGNPGMASGGMGDVLTGMIASFIAQGVGAFKASILGVYYHGLAGDIAAKEKGYLSLLATDLLHKLPEVLKTLG